MNSLKRTLPLEPATLLLIIFSFLLLAYSYFSGVRSCPDAQTYSKWADSLIENGFSLPEFLRKTQFSVPPVFYLNFIHLVAFSKLLFGKAFQHSLVLINTLCLAIVGTLIFRLASFPQKNTGIFGNWGSIVFFVLGFDLWQWVIYPISDAPYVFFSFLTFFIIFRFQLENKLSYGDQFVILFFSLICLFFRPTGILMIPIFFLNLLFSKFEGFETLLFCKRTLLVVLSLFVIGLIAHSYLIMNANNLPGFIPFQNYLKYMAPDYKKGIVVYDRFSTYGSPANSSTDCIFITLKRVIYFFAIVVPDFSLKHTILSLCFYLPLYIFIGMYLWQIYAAKVILSTAQRRILFLSGFFILSTAIFHALTQIDYDWRYRAPIIPHLIFLGSLGLDAFLTNHRPAITVSVEGA